MIFVVARCRARDDVSSSQDAIKRVVEAFERSEWSEIDVRSGDLRVHLSTSAPAGSTVPPTPRRRPIDRRPTVTTPHRAAWSPIHRRRRRRARRRPAPTSSCRRRRASSGARPSRVAPPFADVGHTVDASATVCIVEVMKLMNHVKAGVSGEVVAVLRPRTAWRFRKGKPSSRSLRPGRRLDVRHQHPSRAGRQPRRDRRADRSGLPRRGHRSDRGGQRGRSGFAGRAAGDRRRPHRSGEPDRRAICASSRSSPGRCSPSLRRRPSRLRLPVRARRPGRGVRRPWADLRGPVRRHDPARWRQGRGAPRRPRRRCADRRRLRTR